MMISDVGKMVWQFGLLLGLLLLVLSNRATWDDVEPLFYAMGGYTVGNGVNAIRKKAPSSVIVPSLPADGDYATVSGLHNLSEGPPNAASDS